MVKLTDEQKRLNAIDRLHQKLKELTIQSIFNRSGIGLAILNQRLCRLASACDEGWCKCVTCGKVGRWDSMHGGHFLKRTKLATTLDPRNVNPQCVNCNKYNDGKEASYRKYLVERYGEESVLELEAKKLPSNHKWNKYELAVIKYDMNQEIKFHEKRLGIK